MKTEDMTTEEVFSRIMAGEMTAGEMRAVLTRYHERGVTLEAAKAFAGTVTIFGV